MSSYIPFWEPRKQWVEYEDGGFEPVNPNENIRNKKRGQGRQDWWVVDQQPGWRPEKYANTKRGRQAQSQFGYEPKPQDEDGASGNGRTLPHFPKMPDYGNDGMLTTVPMPEKGKGRFPQPHFGAGSDLPQDGGITGDLFDFRGHDILPWRSAPANPAGAKAPGQPPAKGAGQRADASPPSAAFLPASARVDAAARFTGENNPPAGRDAASRAAAAHQENIDTRPAHLRLTGKAMAQLGGAADGKVTLLDNDLSAMQEEGQQGARPVAFKPAAAPQDSAPGNSAQDAAAMEQAYKRQQAKNSAQAARDLQAEERDAALREQGKQPPERTDAERKADYNASREWLTRNGQKYAREEMKTAAEPVVRPVISAADWATQKSHIRRDMEELMNVDPSTLSGEEKAAYARKYAQLIDILPFDPTTGVIADAVAYEATRYDIDHADVAFWRKAAAHGINALGVAGAVPGFGPIADIAAYESIGWLLDE